MVCYSLTPSLACACHMHPAHAPTTCTQHLHLAQPPAVTPSARICCCNLTHVSPSQHNGAFAKHNYICAASWNCGSGLASYLAQPAHVTLAHGHFVVSLCHSAVSDSTPGADTVLNAVYCDPLAINHFLHHPVTEPIALVLRCTIQRQAHATSSFVCTLMSSSCGAGSRTSARNRAAASTPLHHCLATTLQ